MKIIFPSDFYKNIRNFHLLLDSSFFIDSSIHKNQFEKLVENLKLNNNVLATIDVVKAEFTVGTQNKEKLALKNNLINKIVDYILPPTADLFTLNLHKLIEQYGPKSKGISTTDLILGSILQKYSDLILVTKNPKDFPKPLTNLKTYFLMDLDKGLQTYAFLGKSK